MSVHPIVNCGVKRDSPQGVLGKAANKFGKGALTTASIDFQHNWGCPTQEDFDTIQKIIDIVEKFGQFKNQKKNVDPLCAEAIELLKKFKHLNTVAEHELILECIYSGDVNGIKAWAEEKAQFKGPVGVVRTAAQVFTNTLKQQLTVRSTSFVPPNPHLEHLQEIFPNLQSQEEQTLSRSEGELKELIQNAEETFIKKSTRMAIANIILIKICGVKEINNKIISYDDDDVSKSRGEEKFRTLIFTEIEKAKNVGVFRKFFVKVSFPLLEPVIGFYIKYFTRDILLYFRSFLAEFTNGHFNKTLNQSINSSCEHLATISDGYNHAGKDQDSNTYVNASMKRYIEDPKINANQNMDLKQLCTHVTREVIERFAPVSTLRIRIAQFFSWNIPENSFWSWLNYPLAVVTGIVSFVFDSIALCIEWIGNKLAKAILNKLAMDLKIVPNLLKWTEQVAGIGENYKYFLDIVISQQLKKAWKIMAESSSEAVDLSSFETTFPDTLQLGLRTFMSSLFFDVGCHSWSHDRNGLKAYIKAAQIPESAFWEQIKKAMQAVGLPLDIADQAKETTARYFALLLKTVLKKQTLLEFTLTSLTALNECCFTPCEKPKETQMGVAEANRKTLLNTIVDKAIYEAVKEKCCIMEKLQANANKFIEKMHTDIKIFKESLDNLLTSGVLQTSKDLATFTRDISESKNPCCFTKMNEVYASFILLRSTTFESFTKENKGSDAQLKCYEVAKVSLEKLAPIQEILKDLVVYEGEMIHTAQEIATLVTIRDTFENCLNKNSLETSGEGSSILQTVQAAEVNVSKIQNKDLSPKIAKNFKDVYELLDGRNQHQQRVVFLTGLSSMVSAHKAIKEIQVYIESFNEDPSFKLDLKSRLTKKEPGKELSEDFIKTEIGQIKEKIDTLWDTLQKKIGEAISMQDKEIQNRKDVFLKKQTTIKELCITEKENEPFSLKQDLTQLMTWASTEQAIKDEIVNIKLAIEKGKKDQFLNKPTIKNTGEDLKQFQTKISEKLHPFNCINLNFIDPSDLTEIASSFVNEEMNIYTKNVSSFFNQDFFLQGLIRRLMLAFINDDRRIVNGKVVDKDGVVFNDLMS